MGPVSPGSEKLLAVFATDRGLNALKSARVVFVDGTHDTAPKPFCQIFAFLASVTINYNVK